MEEEINIPKNLDIDKALEEFETKAKEEEIIQAPLAQASINSSNSKMVDWVINHSGGLIKDPIVANNLLMGLSILIFVISVIIMFNSLSS